MAICAVSQPSATSFSTSISREARPVKVIPLRVEHGALQPADLVEQPPEQVGRHGALARGGRRDDREQAVRRGIRSPDKADDPALDGAHEVLVVEVRRRSG